MKRFPSTKGFTLTEMLIVIAIIGILSAISVDTYYKEKDRLEYNNAVNQVVAMIQTAKNYALTSRQAENGSQLYVPEFGYGVYFVQSPTTGAPHAILFANTAAGDTAHKDRYNAGEDVIEEQFRLPNNTVFYKLLNGDPSSLVNLTEATVIFRPLVGEVVITDNRATPAALNQVTLKLHHVDAPDPDANARSITVNRIKGYPELILPST